MNSCQQQKQPSEVPATEMRDVICNREVLVMSEGLHSKMCGWKMSQIQL